ncbi:helix-turn-helix domain-containing protein [Nocardia sp. NPDC051929]|uniref:helix-turn-helix domain-containing protein n=1 Tax=Nocardia sp. NPDC051929 TaxID=3364327 RepID=UPI0037C8B95B
MLTLEFSAKSEELQRISHFSKERALMDKASTEARNLISLKTAAALVDVDTKTIRNWIAAGDLNGFRVNGRLLRVERDELLALIRPAATVIHGGVA